MTAAPSQGELFAAQRKTRLEREFEEFHAANPRVWALFERFAFKAVQAGKTNYSARTILHRIRWHADFETESKDAFKINDHHSPYYARLWDQAHPEHAGLFSKRRVKGEASDA